MNNILIIGLGLIGGSIAKSLHTNNPELNIFAFDQNSSPISIAMGEGIIKKEINIFDDFNSIYENEIDYDLINAGKKPVTILSGGSFCHHADSFSMIRGGHIDYCVLGAMEISVKGDLANWSTGKGIPAVGGAMDLVAGAKNVFVMTQHLTKEGKSKLVKECSLPLTGANVVSRVYSDYAVMEISDMGFKVLQLNTNISLDYLKSVTEGNVYQWKVINFHF